MTGRAVIGLLVGLTSAAAAQSIEEQIRGEVTRYVAAVNRGDPQAVAALYLNDPRASTPGDWIVALLGTKCRGISTWHNG